MPHSPLEIINIPNAFGSVSNAVLGWLGLGDSDEEEFNPWEDLAEDEFALEKAIYQLNVARDQNIEPGETLMTPYGAGLSTEQIDRMVEEYPALDSDIDLDRIEEEFGSVEAFLKASGYEVDNLIAAIDKQASDGGKIGEENLFLEIAGDQIGGAGMEGQTGPLIFNETSGSTVDPTVTEEILKAGMQGEADSIAAGSKRVGMENLVPAGEVDNFPMQPVGGGGGGWPFMSTGLSLANLFQRGEQPEDGHGSHGSHNTHPDPIDQVSPVAVPRPTGDQAIDILSRGGLGRLIKFWFEATGEAGQATGEG